MGEGEAAIAAITYCWPSQARTHILVSSEQLKMLKILLGPLLLLPILPHLLFIENVPRRGIGKALLF